jgi:hypothetical protein
VFQDCGRTADTTVMPRRSPAPVLCLAVLGALALQLWLSPGDVWWSDWGTEALPAVNALGEGDWGGFLALSPAYGSSLVLRAPLLWGASALGGGDDAVYRAGAMLMLLPLGTVGFVLARRAAALHDTVAAALVLGLTAGSPLVYLALKTGHPEDIGAASLAVGGVLLAVSGRATPAGLVLGLAVACKQWAVLAILPAMAATPRGWLRIPVVAVVVGVAATLPVLLGKPDFAATQAGAAGTGAIFRSQTWLWPLGIADHDGLFGPRSAPAWLSQLSRPLIVALALPATALWWRLGDRSRSHDALLVLALLFLLRCTLDPWNVDYYFLPCALSLAAWEVADGRRLPVVGLCATLLPFVAFRALGAGYGDGLFALNAALTAPLAGWMLWRISGRRASAPVEHEREAERVPAPGGQVAAAGALRP